MKSAILALLVFSSNFAFASSELDYPNLVTNQQNVDRMEAEGVPRLVITRENTAGETEVLPVTGKTDFASEDEAKAFLQANQDKFVSASDMNALASRDQLDLDSGTVGWYFYFGVTPAYAWTPIVYTTWAAPCVYRPWGWGWGAGWGAGWGWGGYRYTFWRW